MQKDINYFYSSVPITTWQRILGQNLHYHFGYFEHTQDMEEGLKAAVRNFYPFIHENAKILDLGCGWGGPAMLLTQEKGCQITGVTISGAQQAYCQEVLKLTVKKDNIETMDFERLDQPFDAVMMIESPEHIIDKAALFKKLSAITEKLLIRTSCLIDGSDLSRWTFDNTIHLCTPGELIDFLEVAGWEIEFKANRRLHSIPTIKFWKSALEEEINQGRTLTDQLATLYTLVKAFDSNPLAWCRNFPLIDIIAKRK